MLANIIKNFRETPHLFDIIGNISYNKYCLLLTKSCILYVTN